MRDIVVKMKPQCFEDLIALVALYRPGPLGSGMVDDFIKRKKGATKITYELPELEPILKDTYGVIVYQEQVMQIARDSGRLFSRRSRSSPPCHGEEDCLRRWRSRRNGS